MHWQDLTVYHLWKPFASHTAENEGRWTCAGPDIVVGVPSDSRMRFIIDSMASYVIADGCAFEQAVMTAQAATRPATEAPITRATRSA